MIVGNNVWVQKADKDSLINQNKFIFSDPMNEIILYLEWFMHEKDVIGLVHHEAE